MLDRSLAGFNRSVAGNGRKVGIYDSTLRDGEQAAGVVFNRYDKLALARMLDEVGVDRIEVGMPVVSEEDWMAAKDIAAAGLTSQLWGFCRCVKGDIDACAETGLRHVLIEAPTSSQKLQAYDLTQEKVIERITTMVKYARQQGLYVAFFAVDATRTGDAFLERAFTTAVKAGAQEIVLADTLSVCAPATVAEFTAKILAWTKLPVMVHCHNDFGLATACTLAGAEAGASHVQVTINGLGEKAGNADLAEVAFALKVLLGYEHSVKMELLPRLAELGERLSGTPISAQKPVVGVRSFMRESGVVVAQLLTHPPSVEAYDPTVVGRQTEVVLGKKSGKSSVEFVLKKWGLPPLGADETERLMLAIKRLSLEKKTHVEKEEFLALMAEAKKTSS